MSTTRRCLHRNESGAVMVEAALVMIPLLFFLMLPPVFAWIWAGEQHARSEAHRDMLDKTTTLLLVSEAPHPTGSDAGAISGRFSQISVQQRLHAYPAFPPSIPANIDGIIAAPGGKELTIGPEVVEVFPDGFPNQYVEGWKYVEVKPRGGWFADDFDIDLMRYGAVIRSPWTWMGWPFTPTQDLLWEPQQVRGWYGDRAVEKKVREGYKLWE